MARFIFKYIGIILALPLMVLGAFLEFAFDAISEGAGIYSKFTRKFNR